MLYYIEVTDTFGGEANYSWVTRHIIHGNTMRGAIQRFSRMSGINWYCVSNYIDQKRYDSTSGATCFFIKEYNEENTEGYRFSTDERV
jgi:hypothetical protein